MSATQVPLRLLYIEDSTQAFIAVYSFLTSLGYEVLPRVASLQAASEAIKTDKPDIVLTDLELLAENHDITKTVNFVCKTKLEQPHLILLVHSGADKLRVDVVRVIVAAGISYLIKEDVETPEHLDHAIKHTRTGGVVYDIHVVKFLNQVATAKAPSLLTEREWEVAALVKHMTNKQIANRLDIGVARVGEIVSKILQKLHFSSRTEIAVWYEEQRRVGISEIDSSGSDASGSNTDEPHIDKL